MVVNLRKTGVNAISILTSDVMNRATSFLLYAMVARHLGVREFGQLTLAFTLFYTFQVCAVAGMKILITREVSKDRVGQTGRYFVNGSVIVVLTSLSSFCLLSGFLWLMRYPSGTSQIVRLLSLGLLPYAISAVCEGIFQAWERMHYITYVNVPVNIVKIALAFLVFSLQGGLHAVVMIVLVSLVAIAGIEVWILLRRFPRQPAAFDPRFSLSTVRAASTFLGIDGTIAVMSGLNVILLDRKSTRLN